MPTSRQPAALDARLETLAVVLDRLRADVELLGVHAARATRSLEAIAETLGFGGAPVGARRQGSAALVDWLPRMTLALEAIALMQYAERTGPTPGLSAMLVTWAERVTQAAGQKESR
jgi:hypothetical protein